MWIASHIFITGYKFNKLQWRGPGLSPVIDLSWVQERFAKTVTNNLPILSVLWARPYYLTLYKKIVLV
jgi:hypothetical protein